MRAALASCPPDFAGFLAPRLYTGATAQVIAGQSANRVRTLPSANIDQIGSLEAEQPFDVLAGPACDPESGIIWWRIRTSSGLAGWTAEGVLPDEYFLEVISSE